MNVTAKNKTYANSGQKQTTVTLAEEYEFFLKMAQVVDVTLYRNRGNEA